MENTSIDRLCESFLQTINQYNALEKKTHTYDIDPQIYLSEIHTIVAVGAHEAINVTGLAQLQGTSKSAVSQSISKLVKKGFVEKGLHQIQTMKLSCCLLKRENRFTVCTRANIIG